MSNWMVNRSSGSFSQSRRSLMRGLVAAGVGISAFPTTWRARASTMLPDNLKPLRSSSALIVRYHADWDAIQALVPKGLNVYRNQVVLIWAEHYLEDKNISPYKGAAILCYVLDSNNRQGSFSLSGWSNDSPAALMNFQALYGESAISTGHTDFEVGESSISKAFVRDADDNLLFELSCSLLGEPGPWPYGDAKGTYINHVFAQTTLNGKPQVSARRLQREFYNVQDVSPYDVDLKVGEKASILQSIKLGEFNVGWSLKIRNYQTGAPELVA